MNLPKFRDSHTATIVERAIDRIGQIAMHEAEALDGHVFALRERLAVARKARSLGELLRDQYDLLPASRARLARDQRRRAALWRALAEDLRARSAA